MAGIYLRMNNPQRVPVIPVILTPDGAALTYPERLRLIDGFHDFAKDGGSWIRIGTGDKLFSQCLYHWEITTAWMLTRLRRFCKLDTTGGFADTAIAFPGGAIGGGPYLLPPFGLMLETGSPPPNRSGLWPAATPTNYGTFRNYLVGFFKGLCKALFPDLDSSPLQANGAPTPLISVPSPLKDRILLKDMNILGPEDTFLHFMINQFGVLERPIANAASRLDFEEVRALMFPGMGDVLLGWSYDMTTSQSALRKMIKGYPGTRLVIMNTTIADSAGLNQDDPQGGDPIFYSPLPDNKETGCNVVTKSEYKFTYQTLVPAFSKNNWQFNHTLTDKATNVSHSASFFATHSMGTNVATLGLKFVSMMDVNDCGAKPDMIQAYPTAAAQVAGASATSMYKLAKTIGARSLPSLPTPPPPLLVPKPTAAIAAGDTKTAPIAVYELAQKGDEGFVTRHTARNVNEADQIGQFANFGDKKVIPDTKLGGDADQALSAQYAYYGWGIWHGKFFFITGDVLCFCQGVLRGIPCMLFTAKKWLYWAPNRNFFDPAAGIAAGKGINSTFTRACEAVWTNEAAAIMTATRPAGSPATSTGPAFVQPPGASLQLMSDNLDSVIRGAAVNSVVSVITPVGGQAGGMGLNNGGEEGGVNSNPYFDYEWPELLVDPSLPEENERRRYRLTFTKRELTHENNILELNEIIEPLAIEAPNTGPVLGPGNSRGPLLPEREVLSDEECLSELCIQMLRITNQILCDLSPDLLTLMLCYDVLNEYRIWINGYNCNESCSAPLYTALKALDDNIVSRGRAWNYLDIYDLIIPATDGSFPFVNALNGLMGLLIPSVATTFSPVAVSSAVTTDLDKLFNILNANLSTELSNVNTTNRSLPANTQTGYDGIFMTINDAVKLNPRLNLNQGDAALSDSLTPEEKILRYMVSFALCGDLVNIPNSNDRKILQNSALSFLVFSYGFDNRQVLERFSNPTFTGWLLGQVDIPPAAPITKLYPVAPIASSSSSASGSAAVVAPSSSSSSASGAPPSSSSSAFIPTAVVTSSGPSSYSSSSSSASSSPPTALQLRNAARARGNMVTPESSSSALAARLAARASAGPGYGFAVHPPSFRRNVKNFKTNANAKTRRAEQVRKIGEKKKTAKSNKRRASALLFDQTATGYSYGGKRVTHKTRKSIIKRRRTHKRNRK